MHLKIVFVFGTWRIRKLSSPFTQALVIETIFSVQAMSNVLRFYYYLRDYRHKLRDRSGCRRVLSQVSATM